MGSRRIIALLLILVSTGTFPVLSRPSDYSFLRSPHTQEVQRALLTRNRVLENMGLTPPFHADSLRHIIHMRPFGNYDSLSRIHPIWGSFIKGLSQTHSAGRDNFASVNTSFQRCLDAAGSDAGTLLVLLTWFHQLRHLRLEQQCINRIEKSMLISGASRFPLTAEHLAHFAATAPNADTCTYYMSRALLFDSEEPWFFLRMSTARLLSNPLQAFSYAGELFTLLSSSWRVQLNVVYTLQKWLLYASILFIYAVLTGLMFRALPLALHVPSHLIQGWRSPYIGLGITILLYCGLALFGLFAFAIVTIGLLWNYLSKKEKTAARIVGVLLATVLLQIILLSTVYTARQPHTSLSLYNAAHRQQNNPSLYHHLKRYVLTHKDDYLGYTAACVQAVKLRDFSQASRFISHALALNPSDPVVRCITANISHLHGDTLKADSLYTACIKDFPQLDSSFFIPGRNYRTSVAFPDSLNAATVRNMSAVTHFRHKNRRYFGTHPPVSRRYMIPKYPAGYFWQHVFRVYPSVWRNASLLWHKAHLGISIPVSFAIALLGCVILWFFSRHKGNIRLRRCRTCGIPVCDRCVKSLNLCSRCYSYAGDVKDREMTSYIENNLSKKHHHNVRMIQMVLNVVFPGLGMWMERRFKSKNLLLILVALSSCVYAAYMILATFRIYYTFNVIRAAIIPFLTPLLLYNMVFIIIFARNVISTLREGKNGA